MEIFVIIVLILISAIDIKKRIIPDFLVAALACTAFYYGFSKAALIPVALFLFTAILAAAFNAPLPIGMGDAKLFAAIGMISGGAGLFVTAVVSALASGIYCLCGLMLKKLNKKDRIAFGPFICFGFIVYLASTSAM